MWPVLIATVAGTDIYPNIKKKKIDKKELERNRKNVNKGFILLKGNNK